MKSVEVGMAGQVLNPPVVPAIGIAAVEVVWLRTGEKQMLAEFRVSDAKGVILLSFVIPFRSFTN